jgi:hypothetical protein
MLHRVERKIGSVGLGGRLDDLRSRVGQVVINVRSLKHSLASRMNFVGCRMGRSLSHCSHSRGSRRESLWFVLIDAGSPTSLGRGRTSVCGMFETMLWDCTGSVKPVKGHVQGVGFGGRLGDDTSWLSQITVKIWLLEHRDASRMNFERSELLRSWAFLDGGRNFTFSNGIASLSRQGQS